MTANLPVAVGALLDEAVALAAQSSDYLVQAGEKAVAAREAAGGITLAYKLALRERGIAARTERRWVQCVKDENAPKRVRKKNSAAMTASREAAKRPAESEAYENPAPKVLAGELHEAARGFKAAMLRAKKAVFEGPRPDTKKSLEWEDTGLGHFKKLLAQTDIEELSGLTLDEIVRLLSRRNIR